MGIFALGLMIGLLIGGLDAVYPAVRHRLRDWLAEYWTVLIIVSLVTTLFYFILWLQYYEVAAPSREFRLFSFLRRAVQYLPLMFLAASAGFLGARWMISLKNPAGKMPVVSGIGITGFCLLVLSLFLLQDPRLADLVRTVNTPIFSVEF